MAGPVFRTVGAIAATAGATSITPAKPSVEASNGVLIAHVGVKGNASISTATPGWMKLAQANSGAAFTSAVFVARENAGAPTFTWTGAVAASAQLAYYNDPANTTDTSIVVFGSSAGLGATHATEGVSTTRDNALVVYLDIAAANTAMAAPGGWTENADAGSATSATRHVLGSKPVAASGSASGAISVTGANAAWVQWQVELRGSAAGPLDVSKIEEAVWYEPPRNIIAVSKVETGAWLVPNDNALRFSKVEAGLWLVPAPTGETHQGAVSFHLGLGLGLKASAVRQAQVGFEIGLTLGLDGEKDPPFECDHAEPLDWTVTKPDEPTWTVTVPDTAIWTVEQPGADPWTVVTPAPPTWTREDG